MTLEEIIHLLKSLECQDANVGMINIGEMLGKSMGAKEKKKKMSVKESHEILINDESDKLIEQDKIIKAAKISTENNGIVFLR